MGVAAASRSTEQSPACESLASMAAACRRPAASVGSCSAVAVAIDVPRREDRLTRS